MSSYANLFMEEKKFYSSVPVAQFIVDLFVRQEKRPRTSEKLSYGYAYEYDENGVYRLNSTQVTYFSW